MSDQDHLRMAMEHAITAFNSKEKRMEFFDLFDSDSMIIPCLPANLPQSFEGLKMHYRKIWLAFPDARLIIKDMIIDGNKAAFRYTLSGTHSDEFLGIPATGKHVAFDGVAILHFKGTKCIEYWNLADANSLWEQLDGGGTFSD